MYKSYSFLIHKCTAENKLVQGQDCASNEEIEDYINNLRVLVFEGKTIIDFSKREGNPVTESFEISRITGLNPDKLY